MFYQSRFYDPEIARFIQPDSAVGGNRYTYVGNNPLRFVDPTGHSLFSTFYNQTIAPILGIISATLTLVGLALSFGPAGILLAGGALLYGGLYATQAVVGVTVRLAYQLGYYVFYGINFILSIPIVGQIISMAFSLYATAKISQYATSIGESQGTEKPESVSAQKDKPKEATIEDAKGKYAEAGIPDSHVRATPEKSVRSPKEVSPSDLSDPGSNAAVVVKIGKESITAQPGDVITYKKAMQEKNLGTEYHAMQVLDATKYGSLDANYDTGVNTPEIRNYADISNDVTEVRVFHAKYDGNNPTQGQVLDAMQKNPTTRWGGPVSTFLSPNGLVGWGQSFTLNIRQWSVMDRQECLSPCQIDELRVF